MKKIFSKLGNFLFWLVNLAWLPIVVLVLSPTASDSYYGRAGVFGSQAWLTDFFGGQDQSNMVLFWLVMVILLIMAGLPYYYWQQLVKRKVWTDAKIRFQVLSFEILVMMGWVLIVAVLFGAQTLFNWPMLIMLALLTKALYIAMPKILFKKDDHKPMVETGRWWLDSVNMSLAIYILLPIIIMLGVGIGFIALQYFEFWIDEEEMFILGLVGIVVILFLVAATWWLVRIVKENFRNEKKRRRLIGAQAAFVVFLIVLAQFNPIGEFRDFKKLDRAQTYEDQAKIVAGIAAREVKYKKAWHYLDKRATTIDDDDQPVVMTLSWWLRPIGVFSEKEELVVRDKYNEILTEAWPKNDTIQSRRAIRGLVAVTARQIELVTDVETPMIATITIDETYEAKTSNDQEIIYEFELPAGSVVTDLKLGPNLEFEGAIAPKGAAEEVYEAQIARQRDPALLQRIGENQYRLRVYPVPGTRTMIDWPEGELQRVSFSYVTMLTPDGFGLPKYTLENNVSWDEKTSYSLTVDGVMQRVDEQVSAIKAESESEYSPCSEITKSLGAEGQTANLMSNGYENEKGECVLRNNWPTPTGKKIAVLFDMSANQSLVEENWATWWEFLEQNPDLMIENELTLYRFNKFLSAGEKVDEKWLKDNEQMGRTFEKSNLRAALDKLDRTGEYDLVMVISGARNYTDQAKTEYDEYGLPITDKKTEWTTPIFLLNQQQNWRESGVGQRFYADSIDASNDLRQLILASGGGISESWADWWRSASGSEPTELVGYYELGWWKIKTNQSTNGGMMPTQPQSGIRPWKQIVVANEIEILSKSLTDLKINKLVEQDRLNELAKNYRVVTSNSSLIALVNEMQWEQLAVASGRRDRYETGNEIIEEEIWFDEIIPRNDFGFLETAAEAPARGIAGRASDMEIAVQVPTMRDEILMTNQKELMVDNFDRPMIEEDWIGGTFDYEYEEEAKGESWKWILVLVGIIGLAGLGKLIFFAQKPKVKND